MCSTVSWWNPERRLSSSLTVWPPCLLALVLDELSAELILSQRIQCVLKFEADAVSTVSQGATISASLVNTTCLPVPPRNDAFGKAWGK